MFGNKLPISLGATLPRCYLRRGRASAGIPQHHALPKRRQKRRARAHPCIKRICRSLATHPTKGATESARKHAPMSPWEPPESRTTPPRPRRSNPRCAQPRTLGSASLSHRQLQPSVNPPDIQFDLSPRNVSIFFTDVQSEPPPQREQCCDARRPRRTTAVRSRQLRPPCPLWEDVTISVFCELRQLMTIGLPPHGKINS